MPFNSKDFELNGTPRIISEASVDVSYFLFPDLDAWAKKEAGDDVILEFFAKSIYPNLAACTQPMPSLQEAYNLNGSLDGWYNVVREVNPDTFDTSEFSEEEIEFSDGRKITVKSIRPSVILHRVKLEDEAAKGVTLENLRNEVFRKAYYPLLAGCSFGDVPDFATALAMSAEDRQVWYQAARRQIPNWFLTNEQIAESNLQSKKKEKKSESK